MRYFWHALIAIGFFALICFVFFAFSLNNNNRITFTDDLPELTEPTVTIADPVTGPANAKVTIVNFGDYQCEACQDTEEILNAILAKYPNDVRVVWKDMPNSTSHKEATNAAVAARCAGKQNQFFAYHAYLFSNQKNLGADLYTQIAQELDLRERLFATCVENQETLPLVQKSFEEGIALDIAATPTLFVNGERFTGATDERELSATIESLINSL